MWSALREIARRGSWRRVGRAVGRSFLLRWGLAVLVAMAVAGATNYVVGARQVEDRILGSALEQQTVHSRHVEEALTQSLAPAGRQTALDAELEEIGNGYKVRYALLYRGDGTVLAVAGPEGEEEAGERHIAGTPAFRAALAGQASAGRHAGEDSNGRYDFLIPLATPSGPHVLVVGQNAHVVDALLADLRQREIRSLLLSTVIVIPLSYGLGGHRLRRRQQVAAKAADTDALTGLAGRRPFRPLLEAALSGIGNANGQTALALIDIDEFKQVNDRLGHSYGDRVLVALAASTQALRASDTAFRLGGDEFAVVLPQCRDESALEVIERVRASFAEHAPGVTFSCGVACANLEHPLSTQELWERADAALYEAKRRGRRQSATFSSTVTALTISSGQLDAVRSLLGPDAALGVAFQPIWDLSAGTVLGHEALLRLPPGAPIDGPQEAFDLAQRLGLAADLDAAARRAVLRSVGAQAWEGALFLNVHPDALRTLEVESLLSEITDAGLHVDDVVLEVTEQTDLDRPESIRTLKQLRTAGFRLALDDMGHGNAGLRALTHVQFDVIKIDRAIIARLSTDAACQATVAAATTFVQRTGGRVIAEGIEDIAMLAAVVDLDRAHAGVAPIFAGQGYLLGRPGRDPLAASTRLDAVLAPDAPTSTRQARLEGS